MFLLLVAGAAHAQLPPRSVGTPEDEVSDAFIAYLHGVIYHDVEMGVDGATLRREFPEFVPSRPTPFNDITGLSRSGSGARPLSVTFSVPLRYQVPVDIFGQKPVELQGSRTITFEELWRNGTPPVSVRPDISDLLVLVRVAGYMRVDFADWLDALGGKIVEDVDVQVIAMLRFRGEWYALLGGYSPAGRVMTGVFDMGTSRFRVSPPRALTHLARDLVESAPL